MATTTELFFSTVRIEDDGQRSSSTGCLLDAAESGVGLVVATNRHCVEGHDQLTMTFIAGDGEGQPDYGRGHALVLEDLPSRLVLPEDPAVDLAIVRIADAVAALDHDLFFRPVPVNRLVRQHDDADLDAIEEVFFVGYPNGLRDEQHLTPIARRGITATPAQLDYNGEAKFLIDASVFPGSSGSPVFHIPDRDPGRARLLGILGGGKAHPAQPLDDAGPGRAAEMIDIGIVYKSRLVAELIETAARESG